jgi:hypothetical protein
MTAESIRLHESQKNGLRAARGGPRNQPGAREDMVRPSWPARFAPAPVREGLEQYLDCEYAGEKDFKLVENAAGQICRSVLVVESLVQLRFCDVESKVLRKWTQIRTFIDKRNCNDPTKKIRAAAKNWNGCESIFWRTFSCRITY